MHELMTSCWGRDTKTSAIQIFEFSLRYPVRGSWITEFSQLSKMTIPDALETDQSGAKSSYVAWRTSLIKRDLFHWILSLLRGRERRGEYFLWRRGGRFAFYSRFKAKKLGLIFGRLWGMLVKKGGQRL